MKLLHTVALAAQISHIWKKNLFRSRYTIIYLDKQSIYFDASILASTETETIHFQVEDLQLSNTLKGSLGNSVDYVFTPLDTAP